MDTNTIREFRIDNWYNTISEAIGRAKDRKECSYEVPGGIGHKVPDEVYNRFQKEGYTVKGYKISWI